MAKEHPVIYSAPMVLARKGGRKSQTRRIVVPANSTVLGYGVTAKNGLWSGLNFAEATPRNHSIWGPDMHLAVPWKHESEPDYSEGVTYRVRTKVDVGDRLWVRENYTITRFERVFKCKGFAPLFRVIGYYDADYGSGGEKFDIVLTAAESDKFRKRKRKTGRVPSIFMFRSLSRGLDQVTKIRVQRVQQISEEDAKAEGATFFPVVSHATGYRYAFQHKIWDFLHGKGAWKKNDWVWVYKFMPVLADRVGKVRKAKR